MVRWNRVAVIITAVTGMAMAQPALTNIQDVLYRADGTRFSGTMQIAYQSFSGGDTSNIATANLTLQIVNGSLRTRLVPTTNASAGAQYNITYNAAGISQFTETWAVPPSTNILRVRDVRIASGSVIGPPPVISPVQIGDVIGLANELEVRPMHGVGYTLGRTAVINSSGQIDGASGSLADCVHVDGSSGPCGGGGGGVGGAFADSETPGGTVNGSNTSFVLAHAPDPASSLTVFRNGLRMSAGVDYTLSTNTITFYVASTPQSGDQLVANYRYGDPGNPLGTLTGAQVVCSGVGATTSATTITQLGTCTIAAGVLGSGDRLEVRFQMAHTGSALGFSSEVRIGTTTVVARSGGASETRMTGQTDFSIFGTDQLWDSTTWGTALALTATTGGASEDTSQALTVHFLGQMAATTTDSISLRNFTVIRYPAQVNP
ncbi:MAG: hypothetical protein ABIR70_07275 [Bryobacteraceae bacterium]